MHEYPKIPNIFIRETFGKNRLIEGEFSSSELEYLADTEWIWTEKVDGTNIRVIWDGYRVQFAGRTENSQIPKQLNDKLEELFYGLDKEELFEQKFGDKTVILYGEGYGSGIQKGGGLYGDVNFILFDVVVNGFWLDSENVFDVAKTFNIHSVPVVGSGNLKQAVEYIRSHPKSYLRDFELEGIVVRPHTPLFNKFGNPIMAKIKCRDFDNLQE